MGTALYHCIVCDTVRVQCTDYRLICHKCGSDVCTACASEGEVNHDLDTVRLPFCPQCEENIVHSMLDIALCLIGTTEAVFRKEYIEGASHSDGVLSSGGSSGSASPGARSTSSSGSYEVEIVPIAESPTSEGHVSPSPGPRAWPIPVGRRGRPTVALATGHPNQSTPVTGGPTGTYAVPSGQEEKMDSACPLKE